MTGRICQGRYSSSISRTPCLSLKRIVQPLRMQMIPARAARPPPRRRPSPPGTGPRRTHPTPGTGPKHPGTSASLQLSDYCPPDLEGSPGPPSPLDPTHKDRTGGGSVGDGQHQAGRVVGVVQNRLRRGVDLGLIVVGARSVQVAGVIRKVAGRHLQSDAVAALEHHAGGP